jgi:ABC-type dipeptide/oligopeptide/nickel transport system permease subunit
LRRSPQALLGGSLVAAAALLALGAVEWGDPPRSLLQRAAGARSPYEQDHDVMPPSAPDARHALGTDSLGRDHLSRLLHGARVSLAVGVTAEAIALLIGMTVGTLAGCAGGRLDALLMRATDGLLAFPVPLLAMGAMAVFERPSLTLVFAILGLMGWGGIARLVRGEVLALRERGFSEAARALGAGVPRIAFRHLLPNAASPAFVAATVGIAGNILTESWLSFLGLGAQPPVPSWGGMIAEGRAYLTSHPGLCLYPGLALAATVGGFMLLADALRGALDPRLRGKTLVA